MVASFGWIFIRKDPPAKNAKVAVMTDKLSDLLAIYVHI